MTKRVKIGSRALKITGKKIRRKEAYLFALGVAVILLFTADLDDKLVEERFTFSGLLHSTEAFILAVTMSKVRKRRSNMQKTRDLSFDNSL